MRCHETILRRQFSALHEMPNPLFLIGAGFNADAAKAACSFGHCSPGYCYPTLCELPSLFPECNFQHHSIEECFAEAIKENNRKPLERMCDLLIEADYYVASRLQAGEQEVKNAYLAFLNHYRDSSFLTFNYDALLESLLFSLRR
jgi:hypothetical protein